MFVPNVSNARIANNQVIFDDKVLIIENLQITPISKITRKDLKDCIVCILESNKDIIFNFIQYSSRDQKLYFYADEYVDISEWNKSRNLVYKEDKSVEVLRELKNNLMNEDDKDLFKISLYSIAQFMKKYNHKFFERCFKEFFNKSLYNSNYQNQVVLYPTTNQNHLDVGIKKKYDNHFKKISFGKKHGKLFIYNSELSKEDTENIFDLVGEKLNNLFDKLMPLASYDYEISPVNSNFKVDINNFNVSLYYDSKKDFELASSNSRNHFDYNCDSTNVLSVVKNKENEIFKKIFVRIDDCPKWMRKKLEDIRMKELVEEQINNKRLITKIKKKVLPWMK